MSDFDPIEYFNRRAQEQATADRASTPGDKLAELQRVSDEKQRYLASGITQAKQRELANAGSLVEKMGLDPQGIVAPAVNAGAHLLAGASSQVVAPLLALPSDIRAAYKSMGMSDEDLAAYSRYINKQSTTADRELLNQSPASDTPWGRSGNTGSKLDALIEADKSREIAKTTRDAFNIDPLKQTKSTDQLSDQLGAGFQAPWDQVKTGAPADVVSGLGKLIFNAGAAAIDNPSGVALHVIENLPQLAAGFGKGGVAALTATNAGYATNEYNKGIEKYRAENGGAFPPEAKRQEMAMWAASLAVAEQVGDLTELKLIAPSATKGLVKSVAGTGAAAVKATGSEAATEGYQTFAEGQANLTPVGAQDIYKGAAIGGMTGGVTTGGLHSAAELAKPTEKAAAVQTSQEALQGAVATGDVTALTDKTSATYAPEKAITALAAHSAQPTATEEAKQANLSKAGEIVAALHEEKAGLEKSLSEIDIPALETRLAQVKAEKGSPELIQALEESLKEDPKAKKTLELQLSKVNRRIEQSTEQFTRLNEGLAAAQPQSDDVQSIVNLSMAIPERLTSEDALSLADNTSNGLTSPQRTYLRAFSAARIAENTAKSQKGVSQEVLVGGNGNIGIAQHRDRVTAALAAGNQKLADQHLAVLQGFLSNHLGKAAAVEKAWSMGMGTNVVRSVSGLWRATTTKYSKPERQKNGALEVNSSGLVKAIRTEATAITAAQTELKAAYAVKFSSKPKGGTNVPHVPKAHDAPAEAKPAAGKEESPVGRAAEPATRPAGAGATAAANVDLEAARVSPPASPERADVQTVPAESATASTQASRDAAATAQTKGTEQSTEPGSTADAANGSSSQSAEQTQEEPHATADQVDSRLDVMATKSPEGTAFNLRNLIADYFTQSAGVEGAKTQRPLASVKNFLSSGWEKAAEYLPFDGLTEEQTGALTFFSKVAPLFSTAMEKNLARRTREFWFEDPIQFFMTDVDGKLDLEENVKTAMAYAAFSWVAENASRSPANTDEEINNILGRDEDAKVEDHERRALLYVGTRQNVVANALGQRAVQALGLKANKDATIDMQPKLESSLGAHAFKMLMDLGILDRTTITGEQMAQLTGSEKTDAAASHFFLKLARDEDFKLLGKAEEIFQKSTGTSNVIDKLFGVEPGMKEPSLEPVPFAQTKTRNTSQNVPSKLAEILEKENAGANFIRGEMYDLVQHLDEDLALEMAGGVEATPETTHKANRPGMQAKIDGLKRELQNIKGYVAGLLKQDESLAQPIYFEHTAWKQQRVGIATNVVNPQTSKIHRHMLFRKSWETKVDRNDAEQMRNFQLRVAEGLGVKTDKMSSDVALEAYAKAIANPDIQAAIAILQKRLAGEDLSRSDQEALRQGVIAGGEDFHSLSSLMALAQEANAKDGTFTVRLMGEVDGVTNGPMLSHLLLGAATSVGHLYSILNRGGFFEVGNEHTQYNLWRGDLGHFDLYETTAGHMTQAVQGLIRTGIQNRFGKVVMTGPRVEQVMDVVYSFTGTLADKDGRVQKAGRNIIKTPLTAMVFGSSVGKAVDSMANGFVESIYAAIEDSTKGVAGSQTREQLLSNINLLLSQGKGPLLNSGMTIPNLMEHEFTAPQVAALKKTFIDTVGTAVKQTMESDFATFIEQRKQLNTAAQTAFGIYNAVYTTLHDQMVAELVKSGEIAVNAKTGKPLHDLTQAQEAELRKRLAKMTPVIDTVFSKESGSLRAGLAISKTGRKLSDKSTFEGNAKFATPFKDNGAKSTTTRGYETIETAPGVAMAPMAVHSTDSAISHHAAEGNEVLNIHDAHGTGLSGFEQTAKNLNKATWDAMLSYSPAAEMHAALSRTVQGFAALLIDDKLPLSVITNVKAELQKIADKQELESADDVIRIMLKGMKESAYQADDMKLQALEQLQSIDQYALEGGNYEVTEKNRADASALRAGLRRDLSEKEKEAIDQIESALKSSQEVTSSPDELPLEEDPPKVESPFGRLGTSKVEHDPVLVAWFEANPKPSIEQVIRQLNKMLPDGFDKQLLRLLNKTLNKDTSFQWITPDMTAADVIAPPGAAARGWFVTDVNGKEQINILSPAFASSGVTAELVLHEMTHGALWEVVEREMIILERKSDDPSEATPLVQELVTLREKAIAYAKQNGMEKAFQEPLKNMQEFLAWGMTNTRFQEMILKQISMPSKTKGNPLVNGMKAFIASITKLLFGAQSGDVQENGMAVFVSNVSGLFNEVGSGEYTRGRGANMVLTMSDPIGVLNTYSTLDIHNALNAGDITSQFSDHLRDLLGGIVETLHGPFGVLKAQLMENQALTPFDVWQKALATGVAPFASSVQASPLVTSEQEAHAMEQVEVTVREALERTETTTKSAYRELAKLYEEARMLIKPTDFATQAEYDFIFKDDLNADGRSDRLARFAAFGLAHQKVSQLLKQDTMRDSRRARDGKTILDKLMVLFEQLLEFFHGHVTNTYGGQQAGEKLNTLVSKLVDIEAKKRITLARRAQAGISPMHMLNVMSNTAITAGKDVAVKAMNSTWVRNNKNKTIQAVGGLARTIANDQVEVLMENIVGFRDRLSKEKHGFLMGMLSDVKGPGKTLNALSLASTHQQQARRTLITQTAAFALNAFANAGATLGKHTKVAITQVFMRTGMHNLMGQFSMAEVEQLLSSKPALNAAIAKLEKQLKASEGVSIFAEHYINKANALAWFKMTAEARDEKLMQSAHNIARLYGTAYQGQITEAQANAAQVVLEQLIPLYAIGYVEGSVLDNAAEVLRDENARTDGRGNGVEFVLGLHKRLEQDAREKLFAGQEALMTHGYTPEIYNPNTDVKTVDATDGAELELQGYTKVSQVALDPHDPERDQKFMYVLKDGGLAPFLSGIVSYTGKNAKGTKKHSGYMNVNTADGRLNAITQATINAAKSGGLMTGPRADLSKGAAGATYMVPIVNAHGDIVNWRYMMKDSTKDSVLERDNRFDKVLGVLAGSTYDKETVTELNTKAIQALKDQYQDDLVKGTRADSYVNVGPKSPDPELRAIWSMLPDDTKAVARSLMGRDGLWVRKEVLTPMFGYRKYSAAEMFKKDPAVRNHFEKLFVAVIEGAFKMHGKSQHPGWTANEVQNYAKRAAIAITTGERVWQEFMQEAKDNIVVKSVTVLMGNVWSNLSLLAMYGITNLPQLIADHLIAYRGVTSYHNDSERLAELQVRIDTGLTNGKDVEVKREILRLKDAIERNPVKKLIDAGLMPTIAEDVVSDDDIYSYKSLLARKTDKVLGKLNPTVVATGKLLYLSHDTAAYKGLRRLTQVSDFMARYAMYEHMTKRKENPLSHDEAVYQASESFINYDMPMTKGMQYMDDMGFTMFTKYFLRIQRVLIRNFRENPARVLMTMLLDHFVDLGPIVLDSGWVSKFGNDPFRSGALQLPGTLSHIFPVHTALELVGAGSNAAYPVQ